MSSPQKRQHSPRRRRVRAADGDICPENCMRWYKKGMADAARLSRSLARSHVKASHKYWEHKLAAQQTVCSQKVALAEARREQAQTLADILQKNLDDVVGTGPQMDFYNFESPEGDFNPDAGQEITEIDTEMEKRLNEMGLSLHKMTES